MKYLIATLLILCLVSFVGASNIPTYKALKDKYDAITNGINGELNSWLKAHGGVIDEEAWNKCVNKDEIKTPQLYHELGIILEYYQITEGGKDEAENFDKWYKELEARWSKDLKNMETCYDEEYSL